MNDSVQEEIETDKKLSFFEKITKWLSFIIYLNFNVFRFHDIFFDLIFYRDEQNRIFQNFITICFFLSGTICLSFSLRINYLNEDNIDITRDIIIVITFFIVRSVHIIIRSELIKLLVWEHYTTVSSVFFYAIVSTVILWLFQLPHLRIFVNQIHYARYANKKRKYFKLMLLADFDVGLLGLLDIYIRTVPELIFRLTEIFNSHFDFGYVSVIEWAAVTIPFASVPWITMNFQVALRMQVENKENMPKKSRMCYFFWHLFMFLWRVVIIAAAAEFWPFWTGAAIAIHCLGMATWLWWTHKPIKFYNYSRLWHIPFCLVFGFIYVFVFVNLKDKPTKKKYIIFYSVMTIENIIATILWYECEQIITLTHKIYFISAVWTSFSLGVLFQILYYMKCHPNKFVSLEKEKIPLKLLEKTSNSSPAEVSQNF